MLKRLFVQGLLLGLSLFSVPGAFAGTEVSLSGSIVDSEGVSLPNVRVQLLDKNGKIVKETQSSVTGEYSFFPIIFGEYQISAKLAGFQPSLSEVEVASEGNTTADLALRSESPTGEMLVEVKAKKRLIQTSAATSSTELRSDQIAQLSQGMEVSLPKLLASTNPGVVQGAFGQMFIRGNHASIQYQIDGIQMPESPSNTFGQAVSPRIIDHMEVITGGIPAEYGQRLSAVVNIVTKSGPEKPEGEVELNYGSYNTFTPHLLYGGSNESGSLHYFFSANYFRTDRGIDTPQPESYANQKQGGSDSIHNTATGNTEFAKVDWYANNSNKLSLVFFNSQSNYQIPNFPSTFQPTDPYFQPGFTDAFGNTKGAGEPTFNYVPANTNDTQSESNSYAQLIWKRTFSERAFLQIAPYYKYSSIGVTNDPANDLYSFGKITGASPSSFSEDRQVNNLGLKTDYTLRSSESHLIKAGFQLQASRADGPVSIQTDPAVAPSTDNTPNTGYLEGVYLQDDYTIAKPLILNAGLRFDAAQFSFGGQTTSDYLFQPRIGLNYLLTEQTKFHIFYGKLFQPAPVENLRYAFNPQTGKFNPNQFYDIKAEKDDYYEAGVAQQFLETQVASFNVYYKDGVNVLDDGQLLNTSIAQPFNFATGYAYGAELSIRGQFAGDWSEFVNYSYGIAMGKGISGGAEEATDYYQFMDHVQVHTVNGGLTYAKKNFWWTGQGLYGSGLRTGPDNSISLPGHFTMDTTVGYRFKGPSWWCQWRVSGDVLNILDNRYPITIANGYNGSHYAAGRQFFIRLAKEF